MQTLTLRNKDIGLYFKANMTRIIRHTNPSIAEDSSSSGISPRKVEATERKASSGHAENQSIVQQLTRDGNWRRRARNISPIGLKREQILVSYRLIYEGMVGTGLEPRNTRTDK